MIKKSFAALCIFLALSSCGFSCVVYLAQNGKPKYKLIDLDIETDIEMTDDEKIDFVAARILKKYRRAFEELAK